MFGKKKKPSVSAEEIVLELIEEKVRLHDKAIEFINKEIDRMSQSSNYDMFYGMISFAFNMEIISVEERQALADKNRAKAAELREVEKAKAAADREEKARIIAEHKAARAAAAKAAKAKMQEEK